jgi:hypothetical protein
LFLVSREWTEEPVHIVIKFTVPPFAAESLEEAWWVQQRQECGLS